MIYNCRYIIKYIACTSLSNEHRANFKRTCFKTKLELMNDVLCAIRTSQCTFNLICLSAGLFHVQKFLYSLFCSISPAKIYLFKVNERNTRKRCVKYVKVKSNNTCNKKYFVNIEHVSRLFLVFLLLKFSRYMVAEVIAHKKNKTDLLRFVFCSN